MGGVPNNKFNHDNSFLFYITKGAWKNYIVRDLFLLWQKQFSFEMATFQIQLSQKNIRIHKSDNLQYDTLGCWVHGTNDSSTKCLMFQALLYWRLSDFKSREKGSSQTAKLLVLKQVSLRKNCDFCILNGKVHHYH